MNNNNNTEQEPAQSQKSAGGKNDFIIGLVTFIVFILFMTVWMYFSY